MANALTDAEAILVFGPADTNTKFSKEMITHNKAIGSKIKAVLKADSMTKNQVIAFVRYFYESQK